METASNPWWEDELARCTFVDARLGQRLRKLIERMGGAIGSSLPLACRDWANTKAAYRFFANDRVSEDEILAGHFGATRERAAAAEGTILVLQDTTEFTYRRERPEAIGITYSVNSGKDKAGRLRNYTRVLSHLRRQTQHAHRLACSRRAVCRRQTLGGLSDASY